MINSELMLLLGLGALLLSLAGGLLRALRGPALEDRMLSVLLLLAFIFERAALVDVALVLALLAAMTAAALTRREAGDD